MTSATLKKVTQMCQSNSLATMLLILVVLLIGRMQLIHRFPMKRDWDYLMIAFIFAILVFILRILELLVKKDKIKISFIQNLYKCKKMQKVVELVTALLVVFTTLSFTATIAWIKFLDGLEWKISLIATKFAIQAMILIVVIISSNGMMIASIVRVWAKKFVGLAFIFGLVLGFAGCLYSILFVEAFGKVPGGAYYQSLHYVSIVAALVATITRTVIYLHVTEVVKIDMIDRLQRIVAIVVLCAAAPGLCVFFTIIEFNKTKTLPWQTKYMMFVIFIFHIVSTLSAVYGVIYPDTLKYKTKDKPASTVTSNPSQVQPAPMQA